MNYTDIIRLTSGLLQFGVACYALRLGRLFNAAKVGWVMFSGLSLLALAYVLLPINPFRSSFQLALKADLIYALISVLLLAGMVHLDLRFKQRQQIEGAERRARSEWELEVEEKFGEANKVNEEMRQTVARLQAEIVQQKQTQEQTEKTNQELLLAARQTEADLRQSVEKLQSEILEQKQAHLQAQELAEKTHEDQLATAISSARQAGVTETAGRMLQEVKNLLSHVSSARRTASTPTPSGIPSAARISSFMRRQVRETRGSTKTELRPTTKHIAPLARQLSDEQTLLLNKISGLKKSIAAIQSAVQEMCAAVSTIAGIENVAEPASVPAAFATTEALQTSFSGNPYPTPSDDPSDQAGVTDPLRQQLIDSVTQTGTESAAPEQAAPVEEVDNNLPGPVQIGIIPPSLFGR